MKTLLMTSVGALALTVGAGVAMAQTDTGASPAGMVTPESITCAQLVEMDAEQQERALYFVAGYQAAEGADTSAAAAGTTTPPATGTDPTATAGTTTGEAGTTPPAAGTDTTTTAGTTTDTTGAAGALPEIQVETVMTACQDSPDQMVTDILSQQGLQ